MAVLRRRDAGLAILAVCTFAFVFLDYFRGTESWRSQAGLLVIFWLLFAGYAAFRFFNINSE